MNRKRWGLSVGDDDVYGVSMLLAGRDEFEQIHLQILLHHPGFRQALKGLTEDLEETPGLRAASDISKFKPAEAPYPVQQFAEAWGLSPGAAATLARAGAGALDHAAVDLHNILAWEEPNAVTIRIPRPITPDRHEAVLDYVKAMRSSEGPAEKSWGVAGKKRQDVSRSVVEALPWFARWNQGEEPAAIWRDIKTTDKADVVRDITFDAFVAQLTRTWDRMRGISPDGIRPDRPSKRKG